MDPLYILDNSPLLNPKNCLIVGDTLVERLFDHPEQLRYRYFLTLDDYDYIIDNNHVAELNEVFSDLGTMEVD